MPFTTTWMDLEGIKLNNKSQRKTNTIHIWSHKTTITTTTIVTTKLLIEIEIRFVVTKDRALGKGGIQSSVKRDKLLLTRYMY